jgi:outer membrane biogenesis lipoprotein LolB
MSNKKTEMAGFEFSQQGGYYQLTLSGPLGFGQIQIKQTEQGLLVDNKPTLLTLKQWMNLELGWYFPVEVLERSPERSNTGPELCLSPAPI